MSFVVEMVSQTMRSHLLTQRDALLHVIEVRYTDYMDRIVRQKQFIMHSIARQFELQINDAVFALAAQLGPTSKYPEKSIADTISPAHILRSNLAAQRDRLLQDLDLRYTQFMDELVQQKQRIAQSIVRQFELQCNNIDLVLAAQISIFSSQLHEQQPPQKNGHEQQKPKSETYNSAIKTEPAVDESAVQASHMSLMPIESESETEAAVEAVMRTECAQPNAEPNGWNAYDDKLRVMSKKCIEGLLANRGASVKPSQTRVESLALLRTLPTQLPRTLEEYRREQLWYECTLQRQRLHSKWRKAELLKLLRGEQVQPTKKQKRVRAGWRQPTGPSTRVLRSRSKTHRPYLGKMCNKTKLYFATKNDPATVYNKQRRRRSHDEECNELCNNNRKRLRAGQEEDEKKKVLDSEKLTPTPPKKRRRRRRNKAKPCA